MTKVYRKKVEELFKILTFAHTSLDEVARKEWLDRQIPLWLKEVGFEIVQGGGIDREEDNELDGITTENKSG